MNKCRSLLVTVFQGMKSSAVQREKHAHLCTKRTLVEGNLDGHELNTKNYGLTSNYAVRSLKALVNPTITHDMSIQKYEQNKLSMATRREEDNYRSKDVHTDY